MSLPMTGVECRIPSSIGNLSNESIEEIIYSLDTEDIVSLSLTNRRLNELGMRIVLRRTFADEGNLSFGSGPFHFHSPFSSLRYLRLAFYNKDPPPMFHATFSGTVHTYREMSAVHRYLQTLQCMPGSVSLDTLERYPVAHDDEAAFLDICAELRRAKVRCVHIGNIPTPINPSENYKTRLMQNVLTNLNEFFCKNSLTCPVLRDWTAASLNQSPLVSLSLYDTTTASAIFPLLTLPHLQVLELLGSPGSARDLRLFLNRHPHLKTLHLHCEPQEEGKATALPPLKTLIGLDSLLCSPAWVPFLLTSPDIFPAMTKLSISTFEIQKVVKYHDLLRLVSQYKTINTLTFPLALLSTTSAWLQIPGPRAESVMQNVRTLQCFDECDSRRFSAFPRLFAAIALFPSVETVGLNVATIDLSGDEQQALADDLVDRCSNLRCVNLRLSGGPVYEVRKNEDVARCAVLTDCQSEASESCVFGFFDSE